MKHVIIAGAARSGKTTLSLKLREYNKDFVHYKMDTIKRGLDDNFYEGRIKYWDETSPKFSKLIQRIIEETNTDIIKNKEYYIVDTCHVYPSDLVKQYFEDTIIVFLGYSKLSAEEKLKQIRKYDPANGWTNTKDDETLLFSSKMDIEFSKRAKRECKKYNIKYFETGEEFNNKIDEAFKYIIDNL